MGDSPASESGVVGEGIVNSDDLLEEKQEVSYEQEDAVDDRRGRRSSKGFEDIVEDVF